MRSRPSPRWLVGAVAVVVVLVAVWAWWPGEPPVRRVTGWQTQTDLPIPVSGALVVDDNGDVYVLNSEEIYWLPAGTFLPRRIRVPDMKHASALALGPAHEIDVIDYPQGRVWQIAADRTTITDLPFPVLADPGPAGTGHSFDAAVAVDRAGTVYVTDTDNARILRLPKGSAAPEVLAHVADLRAPIAVSDAGDVMVTVANPAQALLTFRGGGGPAVTTPIPDLTLVQALAFDHRGTLLLGVNHSDPDPPFERVASLWEIAPGTTTPTRLPYTDLGLLESVTFDSNGTIYYTEDHRSGRVVRLAPVR
ncbi:hypothetical protein ACFYTQ_35795 [Nocardia sp. NPDC004068]|uniref:hypothetical protein n=1 Tax=Nocardia sp. NPDC004068 TaxID=3364303 RepID=UPI00367B5498